MNNKTILLASRSETVCELIKYLLGGRDELRLVCVYNVPSLLERMSVRTPDVLLIETCFQAAETPRLVERLTREKNGLRIVAFALDEYAPRYAAFFITRGADSFLCFRVNVDEITQAADLIFSGKTYMPEAVEKAVNDRDTTPIDQCALTAREMEVGRLIAAGYTLQEIALKLDVSPKTADTHRSHIYAKTNSGKRSDFVAYAMRTGLIKQEDECSYA